MAKRARSLSPAAASRTVAASPQARCSPSVGHALKTDPAATNVDIDSGTSSGPPSAIRILSWNIENPAPYLLPSSSSASSTSNPISNYFASKPSPSPAKRARGAKPKTTPAGNIHAAPSAQVSLRQVFAAHGFPDIVCLQEVRALAKDKEMQRLLRASANPVPMTQRAGAPRSRSKARSDAASESGSTSSSGDSDSENERPHPSAASQSGHIPRANANTETDAGPTYTAHFSLCQSTSGGKRFGVATYVSSRFSATHGGAGGAGCLAREVAWDGEGRVVVLEVPRLALGVVNVYALNGTEYAYRDPRTGALSGTRNERKRVFNRLLMREVAQMQGKGMRVVAIGDWNITRTHADCFPRLRTEEPHATARREFNDVFMPTLDVVDVFRELHPDKKAYSWFASGQGYRVDYALVSRKLQQAVRSIEYLEDMKWRYKSDHAPLLLSLDAHALSNGAGQLPQSTAESESQSVA